MQNEWIVISEYCDKCHIEPTFIDMLCESGLIDVEQYTLELEGIAQLDWTAEQMAKQTEVQYLLDEENEEAAESEDASVESAELSE